LKFEEKTNTTHLSKNHQNTIFIIFINPASSQAQEIIQKTLAKVLNNFSLTEPVIENRAESHVHTSLVFTKQSKPTLV